MKPHDGIYIEAERRFSLTPAETVFIDDRAENIATARRRGWHGIVHGGYGTTVESLRELHVATGVDLCEVTTASLPLLSELPLRFVKIRSDEAAYAPLETLPWDVCLTHVQLAPDWESLRERGIKYVQGYALEPPITIADFERRMDLGYSAIVSK